MRHVHMHFWSEIDGSTVELLGDGVAYYVTFSAAPEIVGTREVSEQTFKTLKLARFRFRELVSREIDAVEC